MNCLYCRKDYNPKYKTQRFCSQNCARVYTAKSRIIFPKLQDKKWLYDMYWVKNKSMKQISKELGCGENHVYMKMKEYKIIRRTISEALKGMGKSEAHILKIRERSKNRWRGENNPNWQGGIGRKSLEPRFKADYVVWRKRIILKFRNKCSICGKNLGIKCKCCNQRIWRFTHHIKSVKDFPELATKVDNGILLCSECHDKTRNSKIAFNKIG